MSGRRGALVGRERELDALLGLLGRAHTESGGIALVTGEPGIGKTRLLEEAAQRAKERGFAVAWGRAWELGSAPTYWPWIEALRTLFARPGGRDDSAVELGRLLPELDVHARSASGAINRDAFQLCDAVSSYLQAASQREPVLLVLDDLHAADPSSLALAEFVARKLRGTRLAIYGSHRDVEARRIPDVDAALSRLGRAGEVWVLGRLALGQVEAWVREATGSADAETARVIHRTSEGNPLFVGELLRLLAARGALQGGGVPSGVRAVIRERLALLSPATVALLQAAAVVGREFELAIAADAAGVTPAALAEAVEEAERAELLSPVSPGRLRFSHALVAETLALDLPSAIRARLHRRTAEALEERHQADPMPPLDELAHHLLEAGAEVRERAIAAAERAARAASQRLGFADAAVLYERALGAVLEIRPTAALQRAELLILQGEAWARAGNRARAGAACTAAAEIARSLGSGVLLARSALALGAEVSVGRSDPSVIRLLEQARALLPEGDDPWRAQVMARLAAARQPALDPAGPLELARAAIAMARRLGEREVLLRVLHSANGALVDFAPAAERAPLNQEAAELAAASGDLPSGLRARMRLVFDRIDLGDLHGFERALEEYDALAVEVRQPRYASVALMFRSMRANWEGRFADADKLEEEARRLRDDAREDGPAFAPGRTLSKGLIRDDPELFARGFEELARFYPDYMEMNRVLSARRAISRGDLGLAAELVDGLDVGVGIYQADIHMLEIMADVAWALRQTGLAASLYRELLPHAGRPSLMTGIGFSLHGVVDHALLRMATLLGRFDDADRHAQAASELCQRFGAAPLLAGVRRDHAQALLERAGPRALERAAGLLDEAERAFERLGMTHAVMHCHELRLKLAHAQSAGPAREHSPAASVESMGGADRARSESREPIELRLEGEYWTISGFGELGRLRDSRGLRMLAELIENAGRELHVLDLSGALEAVDGGDAGEVIDREARAAYERRLRELGEEIQEASDWNDFARRERLEEEADLLRTELGRALGLGGRERRQGSAVERARINVRRRLTLALRRLEDACPKLGRHFSTHVRTGVYCAYEFDNRERAR